jgi:hypothetical protein
LEISLGKILFWRFLRFLSPENEKNWRFYPEIVNLISKRVANWKISLGKISFGPGWDVATLIQNKSNPNIKNTQRTHGFVGGI